jgi:hypothetical protein
VRGAGVLQRVGECLLDDAVGRQLHPGRDLALGSFYLQVDVEARTGQAGEQRGDLADRRLRREGRGFVVVAQDADEAAHLRERLTAGLLDSAQHCLGVRLLESGHTTGTASLHDDNSERLGHHVVQFTGDGGSLVGDRLPGPKLPLALCLDQPRSHRVAADPDEGGDAEEDQRGLSGVAAPAGQGKVDHDFGDPDGQRPVSVRAAPVNGVGVDGPVTGQPRQTRGVTGGVVAEQCRSADHQYQVRALTTPQQRHNYGQRQEHPAGVRCAIVRRLRPAHQPQAREGHGGKHGSEHPVGGDRVLTSESQHTTRRSFCRVSCGRRADRDTVHPASLACSVPVVESSRFAPRHAVAQWILRALERRPRTSHSNAPASRIAIGRTSLTSWIPITACG